MPTYSFENTVAELLAAPAVVALARELLPDLLASPFLSMAMPYRFSDVLPLLAGRVSATALAEFKTRLAQIR